MKRSRLAMLVAAGVMAAATSAQATNIKYNFSGSTFAEEPRHGAATHQAARTSGYRGKRTVSFSRSMKPGSILIRTSERALYYVLPGGKAIRYGVGVGRDGFTWSGSKRISRKQEWPGWTPPKRMIERERKQGRILPAHMPGGPSNPLGARAMYLGGSLYRIHGTNQPQTIGQAVSSGCIRMVNDEVVDLYNRVRIGALVVVE